MRQLHLQETAVETCSEESFKFYICNSRHVSAYVSFSAMQQLEFYNGASNRSVKRS